MQDIRISNTFNAMHVDQVNANDTHSCSKLP